MRKLLSLIGLAIVTLPSQAQTNNFAMQGVVVDHISGTCQIFEADDGGGYVLSGNYQAGDRLYVTGTINPNQGGICWLTIYPRVQVSSAVPAFAGVGTLTRAGDRATLTTDDRRVFQIQNVGKFQSGARVYVQGQVSASRSLDSTTALALRPIIVNNVIGFPVSEFARIVSFGPGGVVVAGETGVTYRLDRPGSLGAAFEGDLIFLEGIRGAVVNGVTQVSSVTARPAFHAVGKVVAGAAGHMLVADSLVLPTPYDADGLDDFPIGSKVYVRGRSLDDYDYGEARGANYVRLSVSEPGYSGVGTLDAAGKTIWDATQGKLINLESTGDPVLTPSGSLVYIAGGIESEGFSTITLSNNEVRIGIAADGTLLNGFGCTPIIRFDQGGYIFPKNNAGLPVETHVTVVGGFTFDVPCNDEFGLVDNSIAISEGCWNCSRPGK